MSRLTVFREIGLIEKPDSPELAAPCSAIVVRIGV